jgi:hypothetical protein
VRHEPQTRTTKCGGELHSSGDQQCCAIGHSPAPRFNDSESPSSSLSADAAPPIGTIIPLPSLRPIDECVSHTRSLCVPMLVRVESMCEHRRTPSAPLCSCARIVDPLCSPSDRQLACTSYHELLARVWAVSWVHAHSWRCSVFCVRTRSTFCRPCTTALSLNPKSPDSHLTPKVRGVTP